jgi:hypothetical protein
MVPPISGSGPRRRVGGLTPTPTRTAETTRTDPKPRVGSAIGWSPVISSQLCDRRSWPPLEQGRPPRSKPPEVSSGGHMDAVRLRRVSGIRSHAVKVARADRPGAASSGLFRALNGRQHGACVISKRLGAVRRVTTPARPGVAGAAVVSSSEMGKDWWGTPVRRGVGRDEPPGPPDDTSGTRGPGNPGRTASAERNA